MIKLSIITINYNDAAGLKKTLDSVAAQTYAEIEHIIVDGGSTDGSVEVIREYADNQVKGERLEVKGERLKVKGERLEVKGRETKHQILWVSEPDNGIYNAMNKGIRMATGEYCQFLNSGDILINPLCTQKMIEQLDVINKSNISPLGVIYGNMKKDMPNGHVVHDACNGGNNVTLNMFYRGCLNHSPAYIRRDLFDKYGLYDESLRICSDWKFYLQSLVLGGESVEYADIDMTLFDMTGISETNKELLNNERNRLLAELIPAGILKDYDEFHFPMIQYRRLKKYHLWGIVYFVERVLFKLEKWGILK